MKMPTVECTNNYVGTPCGSVRLWVLCGSNFLYFYFWNFQKISKVFEGLGTLVNISFERFEIFPSNISERKFHNVGYILKEIKCF